MRTLTRGSRRTCFFSKVAEYPTPHSIKAVFGQPIFRTVRREVSVRESACSQGKRNGVFQCTDPANCQAPFELPGYVRMDAAVYYRRPEVFTRTNMYAALNFTNVLDQRYFAGTQNLGKSFIPAHPLP